MPCGIDACGEDGVVSHVDLLHLAVVGNKGAAPILSGMELQTLGVVPLIVVTIDTLAVFLEAT